MKQKKLRSLSAVLLIGWCLIFLRCETTEKSMVRAVYLARQKRWRRLKSNCRKRRITACAIIC